MPDDITNHRLDNIKYILPRGQNLTPRYIDDIEMTLWYMSVPINDKYFT